LALRLSEGLGLSCDMAEDLEAEDAKLLMYRMHQPSTQRLMAWGEGEGQEISCKQLKAPDGRLHG